MQARFFIFFLLFFISTAAYAIDVNDDGFHEIYVWGSSPTGGTVSVFDSTGALLSEIVIPDAATDSDPILFQGRSGNQPIVFSLKLDDSNNGELLAFSANGREKRIELGNVGNSIILVEQYDDNSSSDILYNDPQGVIKLIANPLESDGRPEDLGVRITKKERFSVVGGDGGPKKIAAYGFKKKKSRKIALFSDGQRTKLSHRIPKNALLYPLHGADGLSGSFFGAESRKKNSSQSTNTLYDLYSKSTQSLTSYIPVAPGYFVPTDSGEPQLAVAESDRIGIYSVTDVKNPLRFIELDAFISFPSAPPAYTSPDLLGKPSQTPTPAPNQNGEPCNPNFPKAQLDDVIGALKDRDLQRYQILLGRLNLNSYCPDVRSEAYAYIQDGLRVASTRSAALFSQYSLLGPPVFAVSKVKKKKGGCDKIRTTDGPNGWVLKESDNNGNIVTLAPGYYYTTKAELVTTKGKVIERLTYSGNSNADHTGPRPTFRGSKPPTSYPRHLIVKFYISAWYDAEPEAWCFETTNSHVRND